MEIENEFIQTEEGKYKVSDCHPEIQRLYERWKSHELRVIQLRESIQEIMLVQQFLKNRIEDGLSTKPVEKKIKAVDVPEQKNKSYITEVKSNNREGGKEK